MNLGQKQVYPQWRINGEPFYAGLVDAYSEQQMQYAYAQGFKDAEQAPQSAELSDAEIVDISEEVWGSELDYKHVAEITFARAVLAAAKRKETK